MEEKWSLYTFVHWEIDPITCQRVKWHRTTIEERNSVRAFKRFIQLCHMDLIEYMKHEGKYFLPIVDQKTGSIEFTDYMHNFIQFEI